MIQETDFDSVMATKHPLDILVVDDNPVNQKVASRFLLKLGYHVDLAANGPESIQLAKEKKYDLIFMDIQMPGMDGIETTEIILKDEAISPKPRVVALSASQVSEIKDNCLKVGMHSFLEKPISLDDLLGEINSFLSA